MTHSSLSCLIILCHCVPMLVAHINMVMLHAEEWPALHQRQLEHGVILLQVNNILCIIHVLLRWSCVGDSFEYADAINKAVKESLFHLSTDTFWCHDWLSVTPKGEVCW